jgi:hypothetical protein
MPRNLASTSLDECLRALDDERRRDVLVTLLDADDPSATVGLDALAGADDETRLALIHCHLPKLADVGYVDWHRDRGRVGRGPQFDDVGAVLELFRRHEDDLPWTVA